MKAKSISAPFYFEKVKRTSFLYAWGVRYLLFGRAASGRTNATFFELAKVKVRNAK